MSDNTNKKKNFGNTHNRILSIFILRRSELQIWIFFGFFVLLPVLIKFPSYYNSSNTRGEDLFITLSNFIMDNYYVIFIASLISFFPILFKQIYGIFPLELLSQSKKSNDIRIENIAEHSPITVFVNESENNINQEEIDYLLSNVKESKQIAENIYQRSGTYLLIGSLIAILGVAIFYSPIFMHFDNKDQLTKIDPTSKLFEYLPRIGALFFIEFIAFFFLRQYKIMLEEFRYYEGIKRVRQDRYAIIGIIEKYSHNPEMLNTILEKLNQPYINNKLAKDETTELIESRKIINQEQDFFNKLTELIKELKITK